MKQELAIWEMPQEVETVLADLHTKLKMGRKFLGNVEQGWIPLLPDFQFFHWVWPDFSLAMWWMNRSSREKVLREQHLPPRWDLLTTICSFAEVMFFFFFYQSPLFSFVMDSFSPAHIAQEERRKDTDLARGQEWEDIYSGKGHWELHSIGLWRSYF